MDTASNPPIDAYARAAVIFVPGLTRSLVDRGALPTVRAAMDRTPHAGVVPSFPCAPSVVQASVLCAQLPSEHGVMGAAFASVGDSLRPKVPTLLDRLTAGRPACARAIGLAIEPHSAASAAIVDAGIGKTAPPAPPWDAAGPPADKARAQQLAEAWRAPGIQLTATGLDALAASLLRAGALDAATMTAARQTDLLLAQLLAARPSDVNLLVCGAPAFAAIRAGVRLDELAARCGAVFHACEGAVACLRLPAAARRAAVDLLLGTAGVERVLERDAAISWGFATPSADDLVVLAEPGWAFQRNGQPLPAACAGHPDASDEDEPLALWWGDAGTKPCPPRVHDYRLGTTLAHAIGLPVEGLRDRPLGG